MNDRSPETECPSDQNLAATAAQLMPVSQLQELCAKNGFRNPEYRLVKTEGNSHSPLFTIKVFLNDVELGEGIAKSKKAAKHNAAQKALIAIREQGVVGVEQDLSKIKISDNDQCDSTVDGRTELKNVSAEGSGDQTNGQSAGQRNAVSVLQELCAKNGIDLPVYSQLEQLGSCHEPTFLFTCEVMIGAEQIVGKASGKTKKSAKIASADEVLRLIQEKQIPLYTSTVRKPRPNGSRAPASLNVEQLRYYKETLDLMESLHVRQDLEHLFETNDIGNSDYCFRFNMIAEKLNCFANYIPFTEDQSRTNKYKCLLQMRRLTSGQPINKRLPIFSSWGNSPVSLEQAMQKAAQKAIIMVKVLKM